MTSSIHFFSPAVYGLVLAGATWTSGNRTRQEAHGQRGGMPAAGGQAAEESLLRRRFVEMEGLGIVLLGELLDLFGAHGERARRAQYLAGLEVIEVVEGGHCVSIPGLHAATCLLSS